MRRRSAGPIFLLATLVLLVALVAPAVLRPPTALLWNATASAPVQPTSGPPPAAVAIAALL